MTNIDDELYCYSNELPNHLTILEYNIKTLFHEGKTRNSINFTDEREYAGAIEACNLFHVYPTHPLRLYDVYHHTVILESMMHHTGALYV